MMTIDTLESVGQARSYYQAERGIASYYSSEANAYGGGQWYGRGAEKLGLRGPVHERQWNRALEGRFGKGKNAIQVGNPDPEKRRPGVDLTFSAPKSVTIVALAVGDDRLIAAHDRAVERAMRWVEDKQVFARMKRGGTQKVLTGNVCAALYRHVTDRPANGVTDPQLHTHAVVLNVTQRPDGQWVSINLGMSEAWIKAGGARYRMELAKEIRALGYELYKTKDGFEIKGVSREIIEMFSGRDQQIRKYLMEKFGKDRETATTAQKQKANLATRSGKDKRTGAELRAEWGARAKAAGLTLQGLLRRGGADLAGKVASKADGKTIDKAHAKAAESPVGSTGGNVAANVAAVAEQSAPAAGPPVAGSFDKVAAESAVPPGPMTPEAAATQGVQAAVRHLAERESAFPHDALVASASEFVPTLPGVVAGRDLDQAIDREARAGRLLPATEGRYTTAEAIARERDFITRVHNGRDAVSPIASDTPAALQTADGKVLNPGQANAARHILESPDRFVAVQGVAGAGKTTAMQVVRERAEAAGFKVVGMAPTHRAAKELRDAGIENTYTIARATTRMPDEIDGRTLVIVDESSMVGAASLSDLVKELDATGARAVFVGDTRQLQAIEAGAPFRQMQAWAKTAVLDDIQRQKNLELKAVVEAFAAGRSAEGAALAKAFMREADFSVLKNEYGAPMEFHSRKEQHEAYASVIAKEAADEFLSRPPQEIPETIVMTGTNVMREAINLNIREGLQARGDLAREEREIETLQKIDLTKEQIRHVSSFKKGEVVEFRRDYESHGVSAPVARGRQYEIAAIDRDDNKVTLTDRETGQKIEWSPHIAQKAGVSEKKDLSLAERDRVVFRASAQDRGVINGDRGTVTKIEEGKITVTTDRGATLELRRGDHVQHAYSSTVHSAQGATCDQVIVAATSWSPTAVAEQGYVSLSRAREDAVVITDSKEGLAKKWAEAKPKEAAHEVCLDLDVDSPDLDVERGPSDGRDRDVVDGRERDAGEKVEQKENRPAREQERPTPHQERQQEQSPAPARGRGMDSAVDAIANRLSAGGAAARENFRESMEWVRDEIKRDLAHAVDSLLTTQPAGGHASQHNVDAMVADVVNGIGARLIEAVRGEGYDKGGDHEKSKDDRSPRPYPGPRLEDHMAATANAVAERIAESIKAALSRFASKKEQPERKPERDRALRLEGQLTATANAVVGRITERVERAAERAAEAAKDTGREIGRGR